MKLRPILWTFALAALLAPPALYAANVSQWSTTAANNNDTPPDGWPENMSRSAVNNAAREMMAAIAAWYQDMDGSLVTAGSASSYTLTTNNSHSALGDQSILVARIDRDNTGAATLNVDSLGAKDIHVLGGALVGGELEENSIAAFAYNATDDAYDLLTPATSQAPDPLLDDIAATSPSTGDFIYHDGSNLVVLSAGSSGNFLQTQGTTGDPQWADVSGSSGTITTGTPLEQNPLANDATVTQAHGLGAEPTFVTVVLEAIGPDLNYATGDRVDLGYLTGSGSDSPEAAITILRSSTAVTLITNSSTGVFDLVNKSTRAGGAMNLTDWKLIVTPYLVN